MPNVMPNGAETVYLDMAMLCHVVPDRYVPTGFSEQDVTGRYGAA